MWLGLSIVCFLKLRVLPNSPITADGREWKCSTDIYLPHKKKVKNGSLVLTVASSGNQVSRKFHVKLNSLIWYDLSAVGDGIPYST